MSSVTMPICPRVGRSSPSPPVSLISSTRSTESHNTPAEYDCDGTPTRNVTHVSPRKWSSGLVALLFISGPPAARRAESDQLPGDSTGLCPGAELTTGRERTARYRAMPDRRVDCRRETKAEEARQTAGELAELIENGLLRTERIVFSSPSRQPREAAAPARQVMKRAVPVFALRS